MDMTPLLEALTTMPFVGIAGAVLALLGLLAVLKAKVRRRVPSLRRLLKTVRRAPLCATPALNQSERRVHRDLSQIVGQSRNHVLLAQVSMGEFLRVDGKRTSRSERQTVFNLFNAKRVDFLIVDADWQPCIVVEYQGTGHAQGNARDRDAIKRAVCERAGITFLEVAANGLTADQTRDLRDQMRLG